MFVEETIEQMRVANYGNRSYTKQVLAQILEQDKEYEVAELIVEAVAHGISKSKPLTAICRSVANRIYRAMEIDNEQNDRKTIRLGADAIDWLSLTGVVKAEKFAVMGEDGVVEQFYLTPTNEDYQTFISERSIGGLSADNGYTPWNSPVLKVGEHRLDIVKSARRYKLLSNYRMSEMPEVYSALNSLHATEWDVNRSMRSVIRQAAGMKHPFVPEVITEYERKAALAAINKAGRTALWIEEVKFKQLMEQDWEEEVACKIAKAEAHEFRLVKQFDHMEVISEWSKRADLEKCIGLAERYEGSVLNFIYNCDSRGRVYALQHGLNPQGSDFAKALLQFANPKPVSAYDLMISIANHGGQDKKSYDERVQWVEDHQDAIYAVGTDFFGQRAAEFIQEWGIAREVKSRWQFVAGCQEIARLIDWIEAGNAQDDFPCVIPVGYDSTCSGLQILSGLGRDEVVAPLVNITATERPGDVYQFIGNFVAEAHDIPSLSGFPAGDKLWRKICKRNVMTKCYAATRNGMGDQQFEDRKTYGKDETDKLTVQECRKLGQVVYDICETKLLRASELMECMKTAVKKTQGSIVQWKLPTGFTAYQVKDKSKKEMLNNVRIGDTTLSLTFFTFTNIPNKTKHGNAIAPDVVHSFDAWLLMSIVNSMPQEANLAFVHDQFGSDSIHGGDIMDCARKSFVEVCSRTVLSLVLEQVAGEPVELPEAGSWNIEEALEAAYIVC